MKYNPIKKISLELGIPESKVASVMELLEDGNTIPFIARYRKEATGSLDEVQIRDIKERGDYLNEMEDRRSSIISSIEIQGKMTDAFKK